ncbi:MAG: ABC transporter permease subunit [Clostridia bacterium]|nr:ABC transporter permease subunit [Clostridia bacterium]
MANNATKSVKSKGNKGLSYTKFGYLFIAPFVVVYCLFSLYPLITTFWYSGANMTSTTANFWGFENKEVYYDEFLDLTAAYGDSFEDTVGIEKKEYMKIRNFFLAQDAANLYKPLDEKGIVALQDALSQGLLDGVSADTAAKVNQAISEKNLFYIDSTAMSELKAWKSGYADDTLTITNQLSKISSSLELIANPEVSEEEGEETETITANDIIESESFSEFISSLESEEIEPSTQMLINYLAEYVGKDSLTDYFNSVKAGEISLEDPSFYYVCYNLNSPKGTDAEGNSISGFAVPFIKDVQTYLSAECWPNTIKSLSTFSQFNEYASGKINLHENESQLLDDLTLLYEAGLINNVNLIEKDGKLVPEENKETNILYAMQKYIEEKYESNVTLQRVAMQISQIEAYTGNQGRSLLVGTGYENIDSYISFNGELDVQKYIQFKNELGFADLLTYERYEELDAAYREKKVTEAQAALDEANALLPEVQAKYDAAVGTDGEKAANEELKKVTGEIAKQEGKIKNPKGLLTQVNAKSEYIFVGADNFKKIFTDKTRFNTVVGSFYNTAILWIMGVIPQMLLALILSAWFTDTKIKLKGLSLMKALMYLPNVITAVTIAIFFRRIFAYSTGAAQSPSQQILHMFGKTEGYNFFESAWATRWIIAFINFWMWYGNTMITLIAGISSISESLYESAQIDGANTFQTYVLITLPLLRPIMLYTVVTSLIGGLQMYDIPQNLNMNPALVNFNGSMIRSTRTILMYINDQAFGTQDLKQVGIASAVSILLFITTTILSIIIFYLMRDKDEAKAAKAKRKAKKEAAV